MEGLHADDIFQHYRLNPTEVDAVTYYLPRLLSGETLHGAEKLIHRVEISGCEPKDLAARYAPAPQALSSGDRFFFTTCKSKNGSKLQSVRTAGDGTWTIQKTTEISHAGGKVGEVKNLSFKKKGKSTGWVMEEYRCLLPEATVAEGVKVFCRMHLAQHAPAAARQESAAYMLQEPQPEAVTASTHAQKRPAPAAAADPHPPRPEKRMRVPTPSFTATAPVFLPDESIPEADDDDMGLFSCSMEELLGLQFGEAAAEQEQQADEALGKEKAYNAASDAEADGFDIEELTRMMEADPIEDESVTGDSTGVEMDQHEPLYLDCLDQGMLDDMLQWDLDAPSIQGHDHSFKPQPCSFDPFEAAWKAEEALENEKSNNAAPNLLGGYNSFFSSASVR